MSIARGIATFKFYSQNKMKKAPPLPGAFSFRGFREYEKNSDCLPSSFETFIVNTLSALLFLFVIRTSIFPAVFFPYRDEFIHRWDNTSISCRGRCIARWPHHQISASPSPTENRCYRDSSPIPGYSCHRAKTIFCPACVV